MRSLNLPTYSFKIKSDENKDYIFDVFRKKYIQLTPEEWVRQNFAHFLIEERQYPTGRMVLEKSLKINQLVKRCDILIYNIEMQPVVLVECKAPEVKIKAEVFDQASIYNLKFKVRYLMVTNGLTHYCARIHFDEERAEFLNEIPPYQKIIDNQ
jgi:hypothetical protein